MKRFSLSVLFLSAITCGYAQTSAGNDLQNVLQKLAEYEETYPQEKVYLHLDKPYYSVGDDIWFKAYVTVGQQNFLSALSSLVYVDLIGPDNRLVRSLRLPVLSGLSMGDFQLTDSLSEGSYRIRAYTSWMRNFDGDFFFDKTISVGNALTDKLLTYTDFTYGDTGESNTAAAILVTDLKGQPVVNREVTYEVELGAQQVARGKTSTGPDGKLQISFSGKKADATDGRIRLNVQLTNQQSIAKVIPVKHTGQKSTMQFFPESGNLLAGVAGKVAFKALQPDGKGTAARGYIADNQGQRITDFQTDYAGMGQLTLFAEAGKTYTAHVTFADSSTTETALPSVLTSGYVLSVNNSVDKAVYLKTATTPAQATGQPLSVIAQKNGQVFYAARIKQAKPEAGMSIDRSALPSGVIQLTLMDEQMKPVAERLIFNLNQRDTLPVTVSADKKTYQPREKITMKLATGTTGDSLRVGSFSISVTDLAKMPVNDSTADGILSGLLLSPELKGYIETPGYYFNGMDRQKQQQLDNLMLTQGWRRIVWDDLMSGKVPAMQYQPEKSLSISGTITHRNGKPSSNTSVAVFSTTDMTSAMDTITDAEGRFNFDRLIFYDSTKFVVQVNDEKGKQKGDIRMDEVPRQEPGKNKNTPDVVVDVSQSIAGYLKSTERQFTELQKFGLMEQGIRLDEVTIVAKKPERLVERSANFNGPGNADQILTAKDLQFGCPSLETCLPGRLTGVIFKGGRPYSTRSSGAPMKVLMDGMEITDLSMITPMDVQSIEVLRSAGYTAMYGMGGDAGVIVITTKSGPEGYTRDMFVPGIITYLPQGLYAARQYYAPDYSAPQEHADLRDLRSTIFWKPDVTTDDNGEASFEYYAANEPGRYRIVVEGIDAAGRIARSVSYTDVK